MIMKRIFILSLLSLSLVCADAQTAENTAQTTADTLRTDTAGIDEKAIEIGEVTVTAQRSLIKNEADKVIYDVKNDEDAKTSTIIEILRKVPFVTVDGENNIKVKGNSNFKIYKNGRPNQSFSKNPKEVLSSIPANMIKKIEVITEPGAKYDGEGVDGILNIVMDDNTSIKGIVGSINAGINRSHINSSVWSMVQAGKFTASGYYSYNHQPSAGTTYDYTSEKQYVKSGNREMSRTRSSNAANLHPFGIDASYEADSLNLITLSLNAFSYKIGIPNSGEYALTDNEGNIINSYSSKFEGSYKKYLDVDGHIDYQHLTHRKGESINLSYMLSTTNMKRRNDIYYNNVVSYPAYSVRKDLTKNIYMEHTVQFDWTRPVAKGQTLNLGAKYIYRDNHSKSEQSTDGNELPASDFSHVTQVAAAYGEYNMKVNRWTFIAGVRYEHAFMKAEYRDKSADNFRRDIGDLIPGVTAGYRINDYNSLKLKYNMRINRPGISYLNPAVYRYPNSVSFGNSELESANMHTFSLSYSLTKQDFMLNLDCSYARSDNQISGYQYVEDDIIYSTYGNIGCMDGLKMNAYVKWKLSKTTSFMINGAVQNVKYYNDEMGLKNRKWVCNFYSQITQQLPWKLRLELAGGRNDGGISGLYGHSKATYFYYPTLQRSFLKEDRLTVRLYAFNPIGRKYQEYKSYTTYGDYTGRDVTRNYSRSFGINISYRFGSLNASVKKTNKSIDNSDLIGRK